MKDILVLCRSNSVMSPMVEALINANSEGVWRAFSAGSEPASSINRHTLRALKEAGITRGSLHAPKSWNLFSGPESPRFDVVLTVSEDVHWEDMPKWNGVPRLIHWVLPDPRNLTSLSSERATLYAALLDLARAKVELFLTEDAKAMRVGANANDNGGHDLQTVRA